MLLAAFLRLFLLGQPLLKIIDKVLCALLGQQLTGLVRHVGFLAERLELVPLRFSHHRFFRHYPTPALPRISSISFDASAFVRLSLNASGLPAYSHKGFK